jgi:hypothetical protein
LIRIQAPRISTFVEAGLAIGNYRCHVAGMRNFGCEISCSNDEALAVSSQRSIVAAGFASTRLATATIGYVSCGYLVSTNVARARPGRKMGTLEQTLAPIGGRLAILFSVVSAASIPGIITESTPVR